MPINLHGMAVLKGTIQERSLREKNLLLYEDDFWIYSKFSDPKIQHFSLLLREYNRTYRMPVSILHKLYFGLGQLTKQDRIGFLKEVQALARRIKRLHLVFLDAALESVKWGNTAAIHCLDEFEHHFEEIKGDAEKLLEAQRRIE